MAILFAILANFFFSFAHALSFNITRFDRNQSILLEGDGKISSGSIQLNKAYYFRVGRLQYSEPLQLWDSITGTEASFATRFSFTIDTLNREESGDGLVFFLAPLDRPIPLNSAGGGFGLINSTTSLTPSLNRIVMVEFDTFPNTESVDPPQQHVGIDRNSIQSIVYKTWNASEHSGKPVNVLISYNATTKNLSVSWTYQENPVLFTGNNSNNFLSSILDLKEVLPEQVAVGFSASTGSNYETHDVNSWEFSSNMETKNEVITRNEKDKNKRAMNKKLLVVVVVVACFFLSLVGLGFYIWLAKRKQKSANAPVSVRGDLEKASLPKRFSYQELFTATNGFSDDGRLGRGGSGQVYRGVLNNLGCRTVAVKRLFGDSESSERIFINEVKIISRLIHRNLVPFIGWCHEQNEFLLVYEYMPNGSLDKHLFRDGNILPWDMRYKIALGLASALHYLHEDAEKCVIHRDIKSANILLDTDFSTKLGDFGVAKLVDTRMRTQRTALVGTFGYLAPEYVSEGRATKESDMYSFGVVALELACGRRTFLDAESNHVPLMRRVWELHLAGNIMEAVDERLGVEFDEDEVRRLLMVGLWCSHPRAKERPKAEQVIKVLRLEAQVPELSRETHDDNAHVVQYSPPQRVSDSLNQLTAITSSLANVGR